METGDSPRRNATVDVVAPRSREMYRRFLESDYPEALELAEEALACDPTDAVAMAIYAECCRQLQRETLPAPGTDDADDIPVFEGEPEEDGDAADRRTIDSQRSGADRAMYQRFLESDYPKALELAEAALAVAPDDAMAQAIARESRAALDLRRSVPVLKSTLGRPQHLPLGAREALMLARVDGVATVGEIADGSGLPPLEALHLIEEFVAAGLLELRPS
jgi:tetratricopeptide (TPR) repeat protein